MSQIDISMFRTPEGLLEAEHLLFASSVMLRQAMGEVTACNSLTGKEVFKGKRVERIIPAFDAVFKIMGDAQKAFKAAREELIDKHVESFKLPAKMKIESDIESDIHE